MSTQMMKPETLAYIARFITAQIFHGYNYTGMCVDGLEKPFIGCITSEADTAENIYRMLHILNVKAIATHYGEKISEHYTENDFAEIGKFPDTAIHKPRKYAEYSAVIESWHYQMLKSIECYLYQCAESKEITESPIYQALENLKNALMTYIIHNSAEHKVAVWG